MARTPQNDADQMLLGAIAEAVEKQKGGQFKDVTVERSGNVIVLPPNMSYKQGRDWLQRKEDEEETVVKIYHDIPCFPLDGAYAFHKAIEKTYGWTNAAGSFFNPNYSLSLETDVGTTVQVLWGPVEIPSLDGVKLSTGMDTSRGVSKFVIQGSAKQKHKAAILALYTLTKKILKEESVYKGKAIRVDLAWMMDDDRELDPNNDQPKFMDLSGVNPDDLVFEATTERIIQTTLFAPIKGASGCKARRPFFNLKGVAMEEELEELYIAAKKEIAILKAKLEFAHAATQELRDQLNKVRQLGAEEIISLGKELDGAKAAAIRNRSQP